MLLNWKKILYIALALAVAWVAVRYLLPVSTPFLLGGLMALAAEPGVRFLAGRLHFPGLRRQGWAWERCLLCCVPC